MPNWFRWRHNSPHSHTEPIECYACTRVGIPVFHSTTCDPAHQPEWEALAGSSLFPIQTRKTAAKILNPHSPGRVLDPRSESVQCWNRLILLTRGLALAVDPLFFFAMSIMSGGGGGGNNKKACCIYMEVEVAAIVSVVRTCVDVVQVCHVWLQFRLAYVPKESLVVGCGKLVWDARAIATHYVRSLGGLWLDTFVILPVPQIVYWLVVPNLLSKERTELTMAILQFIFLLQFLPKVYHCFCLMRRMRKVTGYIFGTIWWGFALNLTAYFLASHASGGFWYILALRRVVACLKQQCGRRNNSCSLSLSCPRDNNFYCVSGNSTTTTMGNTSFCLDGDRPFRYGIYRLALPLMSSNSMITKILYSNLWGLMALSTMGNNLEPTSQIMEVIFSICVVLAGLVLFTLLIGNIQVFLHAVMVRRKKMELRYRDMEWWMKRRQLPSHLRQRVRHFENQIWATMGGVNEMELIKDLPDGLRRDIKRYFCLDLIKKVPLFHSLDDVILDNICDRVKPLVYLKDEKVIREGDPVKRIVFIVNGTIKRSQGLSKGVVATSILEPGGFLGDELFSWCLHRPFVDRLPASSATFTCIETTEAYGLDTEHLRYIINHFRYNFANEKLKRRARYYSSNWRTWAAVNIQLAWRRYIIRTRGLVMKNGGSERRLRQFAAMFMSLKPHDHLE